VGVGRAPPDHLDGISLGVSEARCELCGVAFDPRGFQVRIPGVPQPYHSVACALAARERLGLDQLPEPARAHVEHLASSLARVQAQADAERRRRAALQEELLGLAARRDALRMRERRAAAAAHASEEAVAVGGVAPGPLADKLRRRWFERL
jgi:hypothetical protein